MKTRFLTITQHQTKSQRGQTVRLRIARTSVAGSWDRDFAAHALQGSLGLLWINGWL